MLSPQIFVYELGASLLLSIGVLVIVGFVWGSHEPRNLPLDAT